MKKRGRGFFFLPMITPNTNAHIASPMYNLGVVVVSDYCMRKRKKGWLPFLEEATRTCQTV